MASGAAAGDVIEEATKKTIADYLNDGEDAAVSSSPLRARRVWVPRTTWARLVRLGGKGGGRKEAAAAAAAVEKREDASVDSSGALAALKTENVSSPTNLGVGLSLVFLLVKTSAELNKMAEVRTQMEMLLKEMKDEVRKNSTRHEAPRTCNLQSTTASSCATDVKETRSVHLEDHVTSSSMEVGTCERLSKDENSVRIDGLEEEFQAELERLQINYGTKCSSLLPKQQNTESLDELIDFGEGFSDNLSEVVEDENGEFVEDENRGVVEDENDNDTQQNGVCAIELERRLHELLHQRNQEHIEELEYALQCAQDKFVEKEMEVCLWKDTAKVALRHDNDLQ